LGPTDIFSAFLVTLKQCDKKCLTKWERLS
jgi:hypothetical protein